MEGIFHLFQFALRFWCRISRIRYLPAIITSETRDAIKYYLHAREQTRAHTHARTHTRTHKGKHWTLLPILKQFSVELVAPRIVHFVQIPFYSSICFHFFFFLSNCRTDYSGGLPVYEKQKTKFET